MTKVNLNISKIEQAALQSFKEACFLLGREFTAVISEPGAFTEHPSRDLVDTGQLRSSQQLTFVDAGRAEFAWPVEYAIYQHEGYTLRNGQQWVGRPWTKVALDRFQFQQTFEKLMGAKLGNTTRA